MNDPERGGPPTDTADVAAYWVTLVNTGPLTPNEQSAFERWLATDPRNRQTFAEMEDVWQRMGAVRDTPVLRAGIPAHAAPHGRGPHNRRRPLTAIAVAASLALVAIGTVQDWPTWLRADERTATGERRTITLADGSLVQLDTQSAIAVDFNANRRVVRLLAGKAAFSVARDAKRVFIVETAEGSATALGTRFLVSRSDIGANVTVTEHTVRVTYPAPGGGVRLVRQGQSVSYGPDGLSAVADVDTITAMAWTDGVLTFNNAPLEQVVAEIGRYHVGYVRVIGTARRLRVSGVFRTDRPVATLDQLQRSLGLKSIHLTERLILISA
ncbi:FecR family protein [Sphingomonas sanguinis]|uniref:FecR family protein n=1 Tax=Sphingomonas sp. LC-1 TaxID=3110957 RepID=UPI0021BB8006|nr:FecR family protein [Sphingomonas sp. LC-1]MCT8002692.1 FecR family protein [Sphingomonas sp. LC-1]